MELEQIFSPWALYQHVQHQLYTLKYMHLATSWGLFHKGTEPAIWSSEPEFT